jgi:hypothetical protein
MGGPTSLRMLVGLCAQADSTASTRLTAAAFITDETLERETAEAMLNDTRDKIETCIRFNMGQ